MDRNILLLSAVAAVAVMGLLVFAVAVTPSAGEKEQETQQLSSAGTQEQGNSQARVEAGEDGVQVVAIKALSTGFYDQRVVRVKANQPVRLEFSADGDSGCGRQLLIPQFDVNLISNKGETKTAEFTPPKGVYAYRCGMNMFRGTLYAD